MSNTNERKELRKTKCVGWEYQRMNKDDAKTTTGNIVVGCNSCSRYGCRNRIPDAWCAEYIKNEGVI